MEPVSLPSNASLRDVLSDRARHATRGRLGLDIAGGGLVAGVALWARPVLWGVIASASACLFFYGWWAIAERELDPDITPPGMRREALWFAVRAVAAIFGIGAFAILVLVALGVALGRIIS